MYYSDLSESDRRFLREMRKWDEMQLEHIYDPYAGWAQEPSESDWERYWALLDQLETDHPGFIPTPDPFDMTA